MRIARFTNGEDPKFGLVDADGRRIAEISGDPMYTKIELTEVIHDIDAVRLLAPVIPRSKIVAVGKNYEAHAQEMGSEAPKEPLLFLIPNTAVVGTYDPVMMPRQSKQVDYEGELAVVIGRMCKDVSAQDAHKVIFGYTIANDVTARDLQKSDGQWSRAKGFDTFCPIGPWIETDLDPQETRITTRINDKVVQDAPTSDMIHTVAELIEYVSAAFTLLPGDIILTGTPQGVGPIEPGDVVEVEVPDIGLLSNTFQRADAPGQDDA